MRLLAAVVAALIGAGVGYGTHGLDQRLADAETEATGKELPAEWLWATVLDAVLLGLLVYRFGIQPRTLTGAALILVLVQVLVFDSRHRLILNRVIYPAIVVALLVSPISPLVNGLGGGGGPIPKVLSALVGAFLAGGLFFIIVVLSRGGIGLGDAKLAFFMGATLGFSPLSASPILRALLYGVLLGGVLAFLLLVTRIRGMRDYIPYGPYLCLGAIVELMSPCGILGPTSC